MATVEMEAGGFCGVIAWDSVFHLPAAEQARLFARVIGKPVLMRELTRAGMHSRTLMEWVLRIMANLLREDELVIVQGKVQNDRFSGGLRLNINAVWGLAGARARFGRFMALAVNGSLPALGEVVAAWPPKQVDTEQGQLVQGLPMRLALQRPGATAEIDLGDAGRFWPCDEALARLKLLSADGKAGIVYEAA